MLPHKNSGTFRLAIASGIIHGHVLFSKVFEFEFILRKHLRSPDPQKGYQRVQWQAPRRAEAEWGTALAVAITSTLVWLENKSGRSNDLFAPADQTKQLKDQG